VVRLLNPTEAMIGSTIVATMMMAPKPPRVVKSMAMSRSMIRPTLQGRSPASSAPFLIRCSATPDFCSRKLSMPPKIATV